MWKRAGNKDEERLSKSIETPGVSCRLNSTNCRVQINMQSLTSCHKLREAHWVRPRAVMPWGMSPPGDTSSSNLLPLFLQQLALPTGVPARRSWWHGTALAGQWPATSQKGAFLSLPVQGRGLALSPIATCPALRFPANSLPPPP